MAKKKTRSIKMRSKKVSKKIVRPTSARNQKSERKPLSNLADKGSPTPSISLPARPAPSKTVDDSRVFTIEIDSIRAETTIGDLIVAFPRTRDVLMKHGLRFDVEEAGYLYMTLNVFSAIHGLALTGFLQELDVASKEMPLPPLAAPVRQIASPPTT
ncbi:MAG TPA: hypothetical protein VNA15_03050 [Candidatus Angelobacter sp.]|nr:hypothetical protein [Candidatus Angelobacter sp.]